MLTIKNSAGMTRTLDAPIDPSLKHILRKRALQLTDDTGDDLERLALFIVVEPGDPIAAIEATLGFPIMTNPIDGLGYGDPDFEPSWEWIADHEGWFEALYVFSDDGFGSALLVPDDDRINPELLSLCREFCSMRKPDPQVQAVS